MMELVILPGPGGGGAPRSCGMPRMPLVFSISVAPWPMAAGVAQPARKTHQLVGFRIGGP
jgi:hypothetical protein